MLETAMLKVFAQRRLVDDRQRHACRFYGGAGYFSAISPFERMMRGCADQL